MSEIIEDSNGWVDDFRASPGKCGSEISRRIHLHSLLSQGTSLRQIRKMGFSKEMVADMHEQLRREAYAPRVGDIVKLCEMSNAYLDKKGDPDVIGIVTSLPDRDDAIVCWVDNPEPCEYDIEEVEVISE